MLVQSSVSQLQLASTPHLNTSEAAISVSPRDMSWDSQRSFSADAMDVVSWNYYTLPPSPPASVSSNTDESPRLSTKIIGPCFTPESQSESEQQPCLPTNQVFDLDSMDAPSSSSSASPPPSLPCQVTLPSDNRTPIKKSFSTIGGVKKGRGSGERITTKDFVPPDVTGLSKREARLLKNRAAAFLSRQRKREEFEAMEIRVKELEEENSRLQAMTEKGKKYDELLLDMEQLRLHLSVAEKRERELTAELANRTVANLGVKTESYDLSLPHTSYSSYASMGQTSIIAVMKQSLLSSLPSLLSLPQQTSLPLSFSVPLTGSGSTRPSSVTFGHQSSPCDIKDEGRPRFGHGNVGFLPSSVDIESSKKMTIGEEPSEARRFAMDSLHCLGSFAISLDASPTEDGRGYVRVQVTEKTARTAVHGDRQRATSLASWPAADASFGTTCYTPAPMSVPVGMPSSVNIDHLNAVFASAGSAHSRTGYDTQLMPSGYAPFVQYDPEQTFDYYPGMVLE